MTPTIRNLFTAGVLVTAFLFNPMTADAARDMGGEVDTLHKQIQALRIINGLELSDEQIEELIPLVEEGIGLVEDLHAVHDDHKKSSIPLLKQVRNELQTSGEVSEAAKEALKDSHKSVEKATRPVEWEIRDLAEQVMELFDEDQKDQLRQAMAHQRGPGPGHEKHGEKGDQQPPPRDRDEIPERARNEMRERHARHLLGLVFSEEFLDALTDS